MNIKGRLKVGKYFQTAFGLIGKNILKRPRACLWAHTRFDVGYGLLMDIFIRLRLNISTYIF